MPEAPAFWWREPGAAAALLAPLASLYGAVAAARLARSGSRAAIPVICVGNPTIGGAGKTPAAIAIARMLAGAGERPALLSRGYGGRLAGPVVVDLAQHTAADVGDEPLLLARAAPTVVARDRVAGAEAAVGVGASVVVMDDGFQNPALAKDLAILVVDARRGLGNGRVIPAGPLRAPLAAQLARAQALLSVGEGHAPLAGQLPTFRALLVPDPDVVAPLAGARALAFAGIGDAEKFHATLRDAGVIVAATQRFGDHHRYTGAEAEALLRRAREGGLVLVTTEKDRARMAGDPALATLAREARVLPVTMVFDDAAAVRRLLLDALARARS